MDDPDPTWRRLARGALAVAAVLALLRLAADHAGLLWLLLAALAVAALVWRACGALARHLFRP